MKSKLILTITLIVTLCFSNIESYAQNFSKGQKNLHIGVGLPSFLGASNKLSIPALSAVFEVGVKDNLAIGGYLGYTASKFSTFGGNFNYSYSIIGLRGTYHYNKFEDIDLYGGAMLGYNLARSKWKGDSGFLLPEATTGIGGFAYSFHAGVNYMLSEKAGIFGEVGYGIAYLNLGLNIKM